MKKLSDFDFKQKRVLVRCDFNVPLNKEGDILDAFRIEQTIPTIKYLKEKNAKVILMSHLDPGGKIEMFNLDKVKEKLEEYFPVIKVNDCIGREVEDMVINMNPGDVLLLENLRFHKEEKENDDEFAKSLAKLADVYVNDAFSVSHRKHASLVGVPKHLPSFAGLLLEKEIENLEKLVQNPEKPMISIIGGKKADTKVKLIDKISEVSDFILIGGIMQKEIEDNNIQLKHSEKLVSPVDSLENNLDIGPKTVGMFKEKIRDAKTVFWNGPLGKTEDEKYSQGTKEIAKAIIESNAFSVIGGGETLEFVKKLNLDSGFNHISTGGGALLTFLGEGTLPAIEPLE
ncbi:phosphoglycerate kinase [Patescibacteria group bacterium]